MANYNDLVYRYMLGEVGEGRLNMSGTGWGQYKDTQYPDAGSPFTLALDTDTVIPNNAGAKIEDYLPIGVDEFYNGASNLLSGRKGDSIDIMAYFKAVPTVNNQWLDVWLDIIGLGEFYRQTFSFPRGAGTERGVVYSLSSLYNLDTWVANGAKLYIRSNASLDIYGISYNIDRSHQG